MKSSCETYLETIFREMYWKEHSRKASIHTQLSFPVAIVLAFISFFWFLLFPKISKPECSLVYIGLIFSSMLLLLTILITIYYVIRSTFKYDYEYITYPDGIFKYKKALQDYYAQNSESNEEEVEGYIESGLKEMLIEQYVASTVTNRSNNDRRIGFLYRAKISLLVGLFATIASLILLLPSQNRNDNCLSKEVIKNDGAKKETPSTTTQAIDGDH